MAVVVSSGCMGGEGNGTETQKPSGISITIITRHDTSIQEAFENPFLESEFAKEAGVTKIRFMQPVPGLWPTAIDTGGIDVAWGGGPTLFDQLADLNYLMPLSNETMGDVLSEIPDTLSGAPMKRYASGSDPVWVAAAISSFGFTVNHTILDMYGLEKPLTWDDMADPIYFKDPPIIGIGNAPDTTSNTRIYEIILQTYGWEAGWKKLTEIAANSAIYYGSVDVLNAVEQGDVAIATTIDFYGYSSMLEFPDTEYIIPQGQSLINGDPIAILSNTEKVAAAEAFLKFVLSADGQALWLYENINRMPVRADAFDTEFGKTRPDLKDLFEMTVSNQGIEFSDALAISYEGTVVPYWAAVLDKPHKELRDAWAAMIKARDDGKLSQQQWDYYVGVMGEPLMTMEEAQDINDMVLKDSAFANSKSVEWANAKKLVYLQVKSEIENL
ncbi:MAG: ABC transporter substrate-binding protein [Candidatus Methanofastidiosia archaeon]